MKHSIIAAACLACTGAAWSQVTLYGLADIGLTHVTGLAGGTKTGLSSGIMEGSRWGLKGTEDLGGGYKALFTLESRLELTDGSLSNRPASGSQIPDRLTAGLPPAVASGVANAIGPTLGVNHINPRGFDRQAWVGLVTPVGGILAGRQYTPAYETAAQFDIMGTQSALSPGQVASVPAGFDIRYDNTFQYRVIQGPWNAALMASLGPRTTSNGNRLLGMNVIYKGDSFQVGFGHNEKRNSAGQRALESTLVGASTTQGAWTVSGFVGRIREPNPTAGPELTAGLTAAGVPTALVTNVIDRLKQDAQLLHLGVRYDMGAAGQLSVAVNRLNDKRGTNADVTSYGMAYTYPLSKRTNLNVVLTRFVNSTNAQSAPGGAGYLGGVTASAGTDSTSIALGIRHVF